MGRVSSFPQAPRLAAKTASIGLLIASFLLPSASHAALPVTTGGEVWRWNSGTPAKERAFTADEQGSDGVAVADLGGDGVAEIIVGSGIGASATIRTLRADGSKILEFTAFTETATSVRVAVGEIDGDGKPDIVAATGAGPSGRVRVFDAIGTATGDGFLPYGEGFHGGVVVTVGDFNGDGVSEIATMPSTGGGPHVKVWKKSGRLLGDFTAFTGVQTSEYDLASGDIDGDSKDELAVLRREAGQSSIRMLSAVTGKASHEFPVGVQDTLTTLSLSDIDGDGRAEVLVVSGVRPRLFVYDGFGMLLAETDVLAPEYRSARAAVGSFSAMSNALVIMPVVASAGARPDAPKYIEVDISEQRLRAYEYGRLVRTTLVTTGLVTNPTPVGDFSVLAKPYTVNYKWSYGPGNPNNYDLGWVTWNLRFAPHIYLHYAPWRAKFGVRGSHGCVNLSKADAQWVYGWADVGTPVSVKL